MPSKPGDKAVGTLTGVEDADDSAIKVKDSRVRLLCREGENELASKSLRTMWMRQMPSATDRLDSAGLKALMRRLLYRGPLA
jgi:hypothetical protein